VIGLDSDIQGAANELSLAKHIADTLYKHYPDHAWAVNVDLRGGVANIYNLRFSGNMAYVLHLKNVQIGHTAMQRLIMQAGGEILERYRTRRGRFSIDDYSDKHSDFAGRFIAEQ
jgi:hypothetical protein